MTELTTMTRIRSVLPIIFGWGRITVTSTPGLTGMVEEQYDRPAIIISQIPKDKAGTPGANVVDDDEPKDIIALVFKDRAAIARLRANLDDIEAFMDAIDAEPDQ